MESKHSPLVTKHFLGMSFEDRELFALEVRSLKLDFDLRRFLQSDTENIFL